MTDETAKQAKQTELSERLAVLKKNKAFIVGASILAFCLFCCFVGHSVTLCLMRGLRTANNMSANNWNTIITTPVRNTAL